MNCLSPIVLFVYNRLLSTQQIIQSLLNNDLASESELFIFSDNSKEKNDNKVLEVRRYIKTISGFKNVIIIERKKNFGLSKNIIDGVTNIVNKYGKVIVLEDDLLLSPYFLYYMNDSLQRYEKNEKVAQIGACNFFANGNKFPQTFFLPIPDCWGWATWKNRWDYFNHDAEDLLDKLNASPEKRHIFNAYGAYDFMGMLNDQMNGRVNSWAIRWQASCVLQETLTLYPNNSVTNHIESELATHTNVSITPPLMSEKPNLKSIDVVERKKTTKAFIKGYAGKYDYYGKLKPKYKFVPRMREKIIMITLKKIYNYLSLLKKKNTACDEIWRGDYSTWEKATKDSTGYNAQNILEKCKTSILKVKNGEAVYERDSVLFDEIQYSFGLLSGLQKVAIENNNNLSVLDFGGSLGTSYFQNKEFLSSIINVKWSVVEQKHFVDCGRKFFQDNKLHFFETIEECLDSTCSNIILFSGVLQYIENPYYIIKKILKLKIPYIIIDRTSFVDEGRDIITIQKVPKSIYTASYPSRFFSSKNFYSLFVGYKKIATFKSFCDPDVVLNDKIRAYWEGAVLTLAP